MMSKQLDKKFKELEAERLLKEHHINQSRARSITVGTAFGGTTEINMRAVDGSSVWCIMQPVEVAELIHQLSANIGCHILLKPRDDFSSWREWRISDAEKKHLQGHAPFVNDMAVFQNLGSLGFNQDNAEAQIQHDLSQKEYVYVNGSAREQNAHEAPELHNTPTQKRPRKKNLDKLLTEMEKDKP